jgi:hypothetical protein
VEQGKFLGIYIIQMAVLKNISARLLEWAFIMMVHHCNDGDTLPMDGPLGDSQDMSTEF